MTFKQLTYAVLFTGISAVNAYSQALGESEGVLRDTLGSPVWRQGYRMNPTSYGSLDDPAQTEVAASFSYWDSDGLNSPFEGDGGNRFHIYARGYGVQKGKSIFSGEAAFTTGTRKNTRWTDVSDVWMLYPYIVGDVVGGDYVNETYRLSGSYSRYIGRHTAGLRVEYTGDMAHRSRDPRPKNTTSTLVLNPGWTFRLNETQRVGAFVEYTFYKQHVNISVKEPSRTYVFYLMRGMGLFDRMFSKGESSFARYYRSDGVLAGLQWEKSGQNAFDLTAAFRYRSIDTEESDNRIPYNTSRIGAELRGAYRRTMGLSALTATFTGEVWQQKGYESLYERVESDQQTGVQVWRFLNKTMRDKITGASGQLQGEYRQGLSERFCLWYGAQAGFSSWEEKFTQPQYHMKISDIRFGANFGLRKVWKENSFSARLSAEHKANTDASLLAPAGDDEIVVQNMLIPLFDYLKKDYTHINLSADYTVPVKSFGLKIEAAGGYAFGKEGTKRWGASLGLSVSL